MGLMFSCSTNTLEDHFESLLMQSVNFKQNPKEPSDSEPAMTKTFGPGKLIIKTSLSFKKEDDESSVQLEAKISISSPTWRDHSSPKAMNRGKSRFSCMKDELQQEILVESPKHDAAVKLQKVYKSFRTRRQLADCAVLAEQQWWKLLDFALLKRSSVSFFEYQKPESAISKWSRARTRAAKVGKGLSKDEKAQKLALQHWLEAIDPRHRYGHNLHFYYDSWLHCESKQPFFYWLDVGEGKEVNLDEKCDRLKLQQQCIKYLGPKEREVYEVIIEDGKLMYKNSRQLINTGAGTKDAKWIFVLSTSRNLYAGQKKKGKFQHSSFLAGGATSAAGRLEAENGNLKAIWPHSGHYHPTEENFQEFMSFLKENHVDLTNVKLSPTEEDEQFCRLESNKENKNDIIISPIPELNFIKTRIETETQTEETCDNETSFTVQKHLLNEESHDKETAFTVQKHNLFDEEQDSNEDSCCVPKEKILIRINSKKGIESYQLGKNLACTWCTGAGPRIGCVKDYPSELRVRALEQVSLSPRSTSAGPSRFGSPRFGSPKVCSPRFGSPKVGSPRFGLGKVGYPNLEGINLKLKL
ncbi:hypothetical protein LUZ60_006764 [Juncus effusus]|nr:hypothetical protein LUZ60_006764 [Juncus effusus]